MIGQSTTDIYCVHNINAPIKKYCVIPAVRVFENPDLQTRLYKYHLKEYKKKYNNIKYIKCKLSILSCVISTKDKEELEFANFRSYFSETVRRRHYPPKFVEFKLILLGFS